MHIDDIRLRQDAQPAGDLLIGLGGLAQAEPRAVAVEPLVGLEVPQTAGIGADFIGQNDAHLLAFP